MPVTLNILEWLIIAYFAVFNGVYLLLVISSLISVQRQKKLKAVVRQSSLFRTRLYQTLSIIVPAYNEAENIIESVESLMKLEYPEYDIIVVNDGSTDETLQRLLTHFDLQPVEMYYRESIPHKPIRKIYQSPEYPDLTVIDKENGGKADALNVGVSISEKDLFCAIDSDSILEQDVLQKLMRLFVRHNNTIAAGGVIRVINGCKIDNREIEEIHVPHTFLGRLQAMEYLRAFLFGRLGWDTLNSLLIISGAFGIFDRREVLKVGGYATDTVGEDIELIVRLHKHNQKENKDYSIRFLPEPICWTEVPEDYQSLRNQRNRWHRGLAETLWKHKDMMFNFRYRHLGMLVMPFFFFFELLSPLVQLGSYIYIAWLIFFSGYASLTFILLFFLVSILFGMVISVVSVLCEELSFRKYSSIKDIVILTFYAFLENLGYRQVHSWWQAKGLYDLMRGQKEWGKIIRRGFKAES